MREVHRSMEQSHFFLNLSVLFRNTQKYFDRVLAPYDIGSGQMIFLLLINENEGITMQMLSQMTEMDKGTTTKSVGRLMDQGYVVTRPDESDKRLKRLYCTEKTGGIIQEIYDFRNECRRLISEGTSFDEFEKTLDEVCANSRKNLVKEEDGYSGLKIGGLQKLTLLDYPGKAACTVFTAGCNLKCPFCHNKDLVFIPENYEYFDPEDVLSFLDKRQKVLDGVCISGGEPLLQPDLLPFMEQIRKRGFLIKLDTNGFYPEKLKEAVESGLVDYVAMDLKNCREKYASTIGISEDSMHLENVEKSIDYLMHGNIEYEFRTTVVRELMDKEDLVKASLWIKDAEHYYLQQFMDSGNLIQEGFTAYNKEEMEELLKAVQVNVPHAELRGVKEG